MKVLLINGSPHEKGCTYTALSLIAEELNRAHIEVVNKERTFVGKCRIGRNDFSTSKYDGILPVGFYFHILLYSVCKENDRVFDKERGRYVSRVDIRLYKDVKAVLCT